MFLVLLSILLDALAVAGIVYTLAAALLVGRWRASGPPLLNEAPSVTLLKPLYGNEPNLLENLASFARQDYPAPVQILCGVTSDEDGAVPAVRTLAAEGATLELVVDCGRHGSNGKVSNLVNMEPHARGDVLVLSDSDMSVGPDYLARIMAALGRPGTGAVTCLYAGRGDAGPWSRLAAAGISWQFLPGVMVGLALGLAKPCMGSTIALRRETLARIGGFERFADLLADDHAIGAAVREIGSRVTVPPMLTTHGCAETSLAGVVAHELRWNRTVRMLDPAGFAGTIVTFPLPLALAAACLSPVGLALLLLAIATRLLLALRIDRLAGRRTLPLPFLPLRDLLSFALYLATFFGRRVEWRGSRLTIVDGGRMAAAE